MNLSSHPPAHALTDYVTLGRSGLRVSPLCLGAMTFGEDLGWGTSVKASEAMLDMYLDRGGNFIDTANVYTRGHSERIIGDYFGRSPGKRERAVIATKFFGNMVVGDPNGGGAGRKSMMHACHESLRRLQTDYIDLYWVHAWDRHTPIEETLRGLDDLVRAGKVRYIGFSDTPSWKVSQAQTLAIWHGWAPPVAIQIEYSLAERSVESDFIPMAAELGIAVTAWSPLKSGFLTGKYSRESARTAQPGRGAFLTMAFTERNFQILDVLQTVAAETGASPTTVAVAWLLARSSRPIPILGARSVEQLEQNLAPLSLTLSAEQLRRLDEISAPAQTFIERFTQFAPIFMHGGISVNGVAPPESPVGPKAGAKSY